ncbi:MAG: tRNA (adenosine(37)-N6)-threonylcarbamoyltransferase complex ATPase subunit type 1 TsaE [Trueperella sp.]|nr:tRNA (adenosine(37)-N6)-threonylcarbamoyltransferase complex ATPase subunit type 1 TsaE [Trueperella sp.]
MICVPVPSVADIQELGAQLAKTALPGDLVLLNGPLGAGKTTMTQGIGRGLGITEKVSSPTYVIAQIYDADRLNLVHVDAYRLGSPEELDALDLDATMDVALTVVEWGEGKVEGLSPARLEIQISRPTGAAAELAPDALAADAPRTVCITGYGARGIAWEAELAASEIVMQLQERA